LSFDGNFYLEFSVLVTDPNWVAAQNQVVHILDHEAPFPFVPNNETSDGNAVSKAAKNGFHSGCCQFPLVLFFKSCIWVMSSSTISTAGILGGSVRDQEFLSELVAMFCPCACCRRGVSQIDRNSALSQW